MSPQAQKERWAEVKDILAAAMDLPADQRASYVRSACRTDDLLEEVESLLRWSDDAEEFIEQPAIVSGIELIDLRDQAAIEGSRLGPYRVLSTVGEGGVGTVYRAVRDGEEDGQIFALKLVKRGLDSAAVVRRFDDERRILSRLNHPNIGRIFEAGIAPDGRPWFAMEFLEGVALDQYCRTHDLSVAERVRLFVSICDAVEYSHRNLVIHRDLKAANILVTSDGRPRLLDFGIAKILDPQCASENITIAHERLLTPDYASPEQLAGEAITTASDIYSLGVLLYEVLAGHKPWKFSTLPPAEMLRLLHTSEPPRPSALAAPHLRSAIAGDLDMIVRKAMHVDAQRRYSSAEKLADDLRRYIEGRPVRARPDSLAYRATKFLGRHRYAAVATALAVVTTFSGAFAAVYQGAVARSREEEARKRYVEMRELAGGLLDQLDPLLEDLPGSVAAREMLTRKVLHYLDGLSHDRVSDVALQRELAQAYLRLGDVQGGPKASNLGDPSAALASYRKALSILDGIRSQEPALLSERARAHSRISDVLALTGHHVTSLEEEQTALDLRKKWHAVAPDDPEAERAIANSLQELAGDFDRLGRFQEALRHRQQVLAILQRLASRPEADGRLRAVLALAYKRVGRSLTRVGRYPEAVSAIENAIAIERRELSVPEMRGSVRTSLAFSLVDLAQTRMRAGHPRAALGPLAEALELRREAMEADPGDWRGASLYASALLHHGRATTLSGQPARPTRS